MEKQVDDLDKIEECSGLLESGPVKINKRWQDVNILLLAYLGDAVYELWVRKHLLESGVAKVDQMHKKAIFYVQAKTQAAILKQWMNELDETEIDVVRRGRNSKGHYPRNTDVVTYRHATAFESLVGYWYLTANKDRMDEFFHGIDKILDGWATVESSKV